MSFLLSRLSIRNRIWTIIAILIGSIVLGGIMDVLMLRGELWHEKELKTRQLVESSFSVLVHFHALQKKGELSEAAAQAAAIGTIRAMRYDGTEYFWLQDLGTPFPTMIMHPTVPALDGKLLDSAQFNHATRVRVGNDGAFTALAGKKNLFVAFVEVVDQGGEGYVTYDWPKPKAGGGVTEELYPKLSYVKKFAPWGWLIGSGIYIDDVDRAAQDLAGHIVLWVAGGGIVVLLLAALIARSITQPLRATVTAMRAIGTEEKGLGQRLPVEGRSEIAELAGSFNEMLGHIAARDAALARHQQELEEVVARRTLQLQETNTLLQEELAERRKLSEALRQSEEAITIGDPELRFVYVNPAFERLFGYTLSEVAGLPVSLLAPPDSASQVTPEETARIAREEGRFSGEIWRRSKDGRDIPVLVNVSPVRGDQGEVVGYVATMTDLTELKAAEADARARLEELTRANRELKALNDKLGQAQSQLLQAEKMASIGQLAAGVAHEINNPIGYVHSNIGALEKYLGDFLKVLNAYEQAEATLDEASAKTIRSLKEQTDFAFLKEDVQALLAESREGIDRVKKIVKDLKDFSHVDEKESWRHEDLHQGLESTLNVVWNELKYKCTVEKEYGELPLVECLLPQLNQVFMNLLVNAAQAIDEHGTITLRTGTEGERVWVEVADTGKGVPPENLSRLFEPFFTTKPVGTGTGLGLSVSYSIVKKHHGEITVDSSVGAGSAFRVWLPIRQPLETQAA